MIMSGQANHLDVSLLNYNDTCGGPHGVIAFLPMFDAESSSYHLCKIRSLRTHASSTHCFRPSSVSGSDDMSVLQRRHLISAWSVKPTTTTTHRFKSTWNEYPAVARSPILNTSDRLGAPLLLRLGYGEISPFSSLFSSSELADNASAEDSFSGFCGTP